jgi:hypothetical protein
MESRQRERESKQDGRWMSFGSVCVCALNVYRAVWAIVNLVWDPLFSLIPFWLAGCWRIYIPLFLTVQFSTWKCSRCFPTRKDNRLYTKIPSSQKVRRGEKEKKNRSCALVGLWNFSLAVLSIINSWWNHWRSGFQFYFNWPQKTLFLFPPVDTTSECVYTNIRHA